MTGHATVSGRKDLLGSTAHAVLRGCTLPVLVLPLNATSYTRPTAVVMGHDGSAGASTALEPSTTLARALKCELVLVRAVEPVAGLGGAAKYYSAVDDFAEDDLKSLQKELSATGLTVTTHIGKRLADQELLGIAGSRSGSIIAVSTSSISGQPNVLGSTTDRLVRSQTHPVLAIPVGS
jgi:nucleotide-binding universal stress UspA family protein